MFSKPFEKIIMIVGTGELPSAYLSIQRVDREATEGARDEMMVSLLPNGKIQVPAGSLKELCLSVD
jgi:hypothetical protein